MHDKQPVKFAAIEGRWHDEQPASEVLIALPDAAAETNRYEISIPILGSLIGSMSFTSKEVGLTDFPVQDRPPVAVPFFTFRIMVACGLLMLFLASYLTGAFCVAGTGAWYLLRGEYHAEARIMLRMGLFLAA